MLESRARRNRIGEGGAYIRVASRVRDKFVEIYEEHFVGRWMGKGFSLYSKLVAAKKRWPA